MAELAYDRLLFIRPQAARVAAPVFAPASGTFTAAQSVTISCATPGASIRYTSDGSTPTAASTLYASPITVSATTTLKAIALKPGLANSVVTTATLTITTGSDGGGGSFTPASLAPALWFDASDLSTLFQDTAATSPVTSDGQAIALIRDKSGNNRDLTQATAANRPLYRTSGALRWFEFDGARKAVLAARFTANANNFAVAWLSRKSDTANHSVIAGVAGNQGWMGDNVLAGTSPSVEYATATATSQAYGGFSTASVLADHVSILNVTAGTLRTYQNGVAGTTATGVVSVSLDGFTFAVPDYLYAGRVYQFLVFPRALTTAELDDLTAWMKAKAGL